MTSSGKAGAFQKGLALQFQLYQMHSFSYIDVITVISHGPHTTASQHSPQQQPAAAKTQSEKSPCL